MREEEINHPELFDDIIVLSTDKDEQEEIQDENVQASPYEVTDEPNAENFDSTCWLD